MQKAFDFGAGAELAAMRDRLRQAASPLPGIPRRAPVGQMVKSMLGCRTRDTVSLAAYNRLLVRYPGWSELAAAPAKAVEAMIADVTFPESKAEQIAQALQLIGKSHPDFDLSFLAQWPVERALAWLEELPGVGRKVAASTLNFSTLAMPAFVLDTHVLRILRHCGFISAKTDDALPAYAIVMPALAGWSAAELAEFHVLLKHLGQSICRKGRENCTICPLDRVCREALRKARAARSSNTETGVSRSPAGRLRPRQA
ncbi:endonuclease [Bosea caraganae]|uniref:Endonuclease n=1 Tax=Bosea caraganae TaxID=2763117 RepID=A0A370L592_9HYPH|nr:endonuclease [Bosea caraganae]RDJ24254.1 endonuclease [Bosea caraganae]RDJ30296.1 endonuclease [Bosea caraganae]